MSRCCLGLLVGLLHGRSLNLVSRDNSLIREHSIPGSQGSVGPQGMTKASKDRLALKLSRGDHRGYDASKDRLALEARRAPSEQRPPGPRTRGPQGIQGEQGDVAEQDTPTSTTISSPPSRSHNRSGDRLSIARYDQETVIGTYCTKVIEFQYLASRW